MLVALARVEARITSCGFSARRNKNEASITTVPLYPNYRSAYLRPTDQHFRSGLGVWLRRLMLLRPF